MFDVSVQCGKNALTGKLVLKIFEMVTRLIKTSSFMCLTHTFQFEKAKNNRLQQRRPSLSSAIQKCVYISFSSELIFIKIIKK